MLAVTDSTSTETHDIHPDTRLGAVHYTVADLGRQSAFYQERLGFRMHWRQAHSAGLGAGGEDLVVLTQVPGARPVPGTTGLYHTAFLLPTRLALAKAIERIAQTRTPVQGGSNHGTHLALYLADPEGNGIELAWDFPREVWAPLVALLRRNAIEALSQMRAPLDVRGLLDEAGRHPGKWPGLPAGTRVGHGHLQVTSLVSTSDFYHGLLGFEAMFNMPQMGAAFFAAGGCHHHIGANTWAGAGLPPAPAHASGLDEFTILLPGQSELDSPVERLKRAGVQLEAGATGILLRDPSQIGVRLAVDGASRTQTLS
jgi:catechol 2,3-dioxygenase